MNEQKKLQFCDYCKQWFYCTDLELFQHQYNAEESTDVWLKRMIIETHLATSYAHLQRLISTPAREFVKGDVK